MCACRHNNKFLTWILACPDNSWRTLPSERERESRTAFCTVSFSTFNDSIQWLSWNGGIRIYRDFLQEQWHAKCVFIERISPLWSHIIQTCTLMYEPPPHELHLNWDAERVKSTRQKAKTQRRSKAFKAFILLFKAFIVEGSSLPGSSSHVARIRRFIFLLSWKFVHSLHRVSLAAGAWEASNIIILALLSKHFKSILRFCCCGGSCVPDINFRRVPDIYFGQYN